MTVLHVTPIGPDADAPEGTPLGRSLCAQTDGRWQWRTADPGPDDALVEIDTTTTLRSDAVALWLAGLASRPDAGAVYADIELAGVRINRPAWSPTRARSEPAAHRPLVRRARTEPLPTTTVVHIPAPLTCHVAPPTASPPADTGWEPGHRPGTHRIRPDPSAPPLSVLVPTAATRHPVDGTPMVESCLASLAALSRPPAEVLVVVGDEYDGDPAALTTPEGLDVRIVHRGPGSFDFPLAINAGLLAAAGDHVLLLNDDVEWRDHDGPARMAAHLRDPTVGVVGALLRYPSGPIQHAGMVLDDAHPLHAFVGWEPDATSRHGGDVARDVVAVTGACLLARRAELLAVGGLSRQFPLSFNDTDLCLRIRRCGLRVVMEPDAVAVHHESASRRPHIDPWEWDRWIHRWGEVVDPWYHPGHHRPDDPDDLRRNADHLDGAPWESTVPRDTAIRPRVHHSRVAPEPVS